MKQLYSKLIFLCLFIFSIGHVTAQDCSSSFTVSTASTPSTCQANGTVTVTLSGDLTNLYNIQYGLTSPTTGFTINPQEHNVLTNIPAGTYTVTVRAFCSVNAGYDVVKTVTNVSVGGNYKVPSVSFNATSSRKSYDVCNTGIIVLNVTDGSGTFTFNITSAPAGATTGIITPTRSGSLYTFPGQDYPSGDYVVEIDDGCYHSVATFTLGQVTGFPPFVYSNYQGPRPTLTDNTCSSLYWYTGTVGTGNPDYYRYYADGMYEVGAGPVGSMPTAWTAWIGANLVSSGLLLDISPNTYADFYTPNNISVYTRLKGCSAAYTSFNAYLKKPTMTNSVTNRGCENYTYTIRPWTDYDGLFCYPVAIKVTKSIGGEVVFNNPSWSYSTTGQVVTLDYNTSYTITMTDPNGTVATSSVNTNRDMTFTTNLVNCDNYQLQYYAPSGTTCWPIMVTITDAGGQVVCTDSVTTTSVRQSCPLSFGQTYTFKATYPNSIPEYTYTTTKTVASGLPTTVNLTRSYSNACIEDNGYFYTTVSSATPWPVGTTLTITGPPGYTTQTYTATASNWYYYWPTTTIPAGNYTLTVDFGCGTPITTQITQNGVYSGKALSYTTENTCSGMKVTPSGLMTYQGTNTTTYYRLTSGPVGFDKTVKSPGGSFIFSAPGTYVLGILNTNDANACVINTKTIVYTAPPLALSQTGSSAYECTDGSTGVILLQAINGVAPYTYQLWNKDNTVKIGLPDIVTPGQAHFDYGQADSTYTARIIDQCGNSFSQQITMAKLSTARIVYATNNNVCTGDTIELKCITLGNTAYNWTGPNGFSTTIQNPKIANADTTMTGWYRVTVMPEFCGDPVQDSVYINVYKPLTAGAVTGSQAVCVRTVANALSCNISGGSGVYTYQWQSSANGTTGWTNIAGATSATYTPPTLIQSRTTYYHVIVTDRCGIVTSNSMAVNFKPCYIPVNPNIWSRGGR